MKAKTVLSTKDIGKYYYQPVKFKVLDDISFEAYQGELLTLIGKSGSGKSTLLYVLSTMDTEYEGELFIEGEKKLDSNKTGWLLYETKTSDLFSSSITCCQSSVA
jgi:ABC-type dipeptide/oligopeptide/nickel transport system ATPase subunit